MALWFHTESNFIHQGCNWNRWGSVGMRFECHNPLFPPLGFWMSGRLAFMRLPVWCPLRSTVGILSVLHVPISTLLPSLLYLPLHSLFSCVSLCLSVWLSFSSILLLSFSNNGQLTIEVKSGPHCKMSSKGRHFLVVFLSRFFLRKAVAWEQVFNSSFYSTVQHSLFWNQCC